MPLDRALIGCNDPWNALDHFDPTAPTRRLWTQFNFLRSTYSALLDGFALTKLGNWTTFIERPGSGGVQTQLGLWSISRGAIPGQVLNGTHNDTVWLFMSNENATETWSFDCDGPDWIPSPYQGGMVVRNLLYPYENYTLQESLASYFNNGMAPFFGCMESITMDPYGFKILVLQDEWVEVPPALTGFSPGHDARILSSPNDSMSVNISLEFSTEMDCDSVTGSISLLMSSAGHGSTPAIVDTVCGPFSNIPLANNLITGASQTAWVWNATLTNFPDGILTLTVNNPSSSSGLSTGVHSLAFI